MVNGNRVTLIAIQTDVDDSKQTGLVASKDGRIIYHSMKGWDRVRPRNLMDRAVRANPLTYRERRGNNIYEGFYFGFVADMQTIDDEDFGRLVKRIYATEKGREIKDCLNLMEDFYEQAGGKRQNMGSIEEYQDMKRALNESSTELAPIVAKHIADKLDGKLDWDPNDSLCVPRFEVIGPLEVKAGHLLRSSEEGVEDTQILYRNVDDSGLYRRVKAVTSGGKEIEVPYMIGLLSKCIRASARVEGVDNVKDAISRMLPRLTDWEHRQVFSRMFGIYQQRQNNEYGKIRREVDVDRKDRPMNAIPWKMGNSGEPVLSGRYIGSEETDDSNAALHYIESDGMRLRVVCNPNFDGMLRKMHRDQPMAIGDARKTRVLTEKRNGKKNGKKA